MDDKYKHAYQIPDLEMTVHKEAGDRGCPGGSWRVTIWLDGSEALVREFFLDVNGVDVNGAERKAKDLYNKLRRALHV